MVTQWAKTAFLSGLRGLRGGTLTLECPDRTYRFGDDDDLDATLVVHDERFFLRALTGERHRHRRVVHGWRLDDARSGAAGAADAAQPAGARRAEPH